MTEPKVSEKEMLDKWFITAMSHMRVYLENNDVPWREGDEICFNIIRDLIPEYFRIKSGQGK